VWLTVAVSIMVGVLGFAYYASSTAVSRRRLHADASHVTGELAEVLALPAWNLDKEGIERVARAYLKSEHLVGVRVELHYDSEVDVVYDDMPQDADGMIRRRHHIVKGTSKLGVVESAFTDEGIRRIQKQTITAMMTTTALVIVVIVLGTRHILHSLLTKPLRRLTSGIGRIAGGEYRRTLAPVAQEDINVIIDEVNLMAGQIAARTEELHRHRERLEELVAERTADLRKTNEQLEGEIAERRRAERGLELTLAELKRSNAELTHFAYIASHDLQEPLRKVRSFTQLFARHYRDKVDEDGQRYIDFITDGADRMQGLIRDLLTYSRVGRAELDLAPTDLGEIVAYILASIEMRISDTNAVVTVDELPTLPINAKLIGMVFQNLLLNALKFKGEQPPGIRVSAARAKGEWVFSVRDNGIGMESRHFVRIFQVFQRLHGRGEYPGSGMGLAVCKKIVERHGGRIWVESEPGKGSTFFFSIPDRGIVCAKGEHTACQTE